MLNKDLIVSSFAAHQKFMYYRMSNKKKMMEFLNKSQQILESIEENKEPVLMKLPKKDCGQNIAIDIYNEICYNINKRFTDENVISKTHNEAIEDNVWELLYGTTSL